MNRTESKRLLEVWKMKENAYRQVRNSATVEEMVAKRIEICKKPMSSVKQEKTYAR